MADSDRCLRRRQRRSLFVILLTHTSGFTYPPQVLGVGEVAQQYNEVGVLATSSMSEEFADIAFAVTFSRAAW